MDKSHITPNVDTKVEALNDLSQKLGGANSAGNITEAIQNITKVAGPGGGGGGSIDTLDGVDINDPTDGDVLVYDEATGEWVNGWAGDSTEVTLQSGVVTQISTDGASYHAVHAANYTDTGSGEYDILKSTQFVSSNGVLQYITAQDSSNNQVNFSLPTIEVNAEDGIANNIDDGHDIYMIPQITGSDPDSGDEFVAERLNLIYSLRGGTRTLRYISVKDSNGQWIDINIPGGS